jgi:hypothetical protein
MPGKAYREITRLAKFCAGISCLVEVTSKIEQIL